jgi:DNA polymerase
MNAQPGAEQFLPDRTSLRTLRTAAAECQGCDLYADATQTVFGEGAADARLVLVGEQPGDQEDRAGKPFVGPAGRLLDRVLTEAGLAEIPSYVTNAVKHFRFTPAQRGKRRIHQPPNRGQQLACRPWLLAELRTVHPELVVCLGATAAHSLLGPDFRLTAHRGELIEPPSEAIATTTPKSLRLMATVHPSSVLRAKDREQAYQSLLADLRVAADCLK